ncbi:hypothetical protein C1N71_14785 [Agrococcus sp. SGAir0287]|nr:hypothetical protein C1N71_14785 [Agrococcus sp. SGAir0287]
MHAVGVTAVWPLFRASTGKSGHRLHGADRPVGSYEENFSTALHSMREAPTLRVGPPPLVERHCFTWNIEGTAHTEQRRRDARRNEIDVCRADMPKHSTTMAGGRQATTADDDASP